MKQMTWTPILLSSAATLVLLLGDNGCLGRDVPMTSAGIPYFTSQEGRAYKAQVGNSAVLECRVENLGESNVIWKESNRIISAGTIIIRKDSRLRLENGYNLRIDDLMESDSGEYVCEIETFGSPMHQTSRLEILVPPSVQPLPQDGKFVVRKGSTITLECEAKGNPTPKITWLRKNNLLPSGEKFEEGNSVIIQDVSRHHSGIYVCTADNDVGTPARAEIDLKVLYPPEIEVDQTWIPTGEGIEAVVSCNIHAEPVASVKWYKDTMLLDPTDNRQMRTFGNKHELTLKNVRETDFGNYSCMADNSLGRERGSIEVSGRPHASKIVSNSLGSFKDQYNLTWTVNSFLPIEEYRILYRVNTAHFVNDAYQFASSAKSGRVSKSYSKQPIEWTNIIPQIENPHPTSQFANRFTYTGNFVFYGLDASTEYEVIIQSRNKEGWSDASDIFRFSTRDRDYNPMELASHNQQGFFSSAESVVATSTSTILLVLMSLLMAF
eukprot:10757.XXX_265016_286838_1 [CDS] Oithona nana genome sequencing.